MDALRRYVFPVIWLLIFAVIAVSLAYMAFFSGDADASAGEDPEFPTADFDQYATVPVETGDIASELTLPAVVQPDAGTELKATDDGEINKIWVHEGDTVEKGQKILQVRAPQDADPAAALADASGGTAPSTAGDESDDADGPGATGGADDAGAADGAGTTGGGDEATADQPASAPQEAATEYTYRTLTATAAGTITGLELEEWQTLATGDVVATLSPGTYSIIADLTPEQQLSLLDVDIKATATLPTSTDPITCSSPGITEDTEVEEPEEPQIDPMTGEETTSSVSAAQLECPVPEGTRIVPGLSVEMSVDLGAAQDVLTVPTTAVEGEGEGEAGTVYTLDESTGEPVAVDVGLGLRGNGDVEITDGLEEGQEILQFAPGVDDPEDDMGGMDVW